MRAAARPIPIACLAFTLLLTGQAAAAEYRIVAPSAQGSGWDHLAQTLKSVLAQDRAENDVEIVNAPGGGGTVGLNQFLADNAPKGLLVTGLTMLDATFVHRVPIGLERLTPIARLSAEHYVVAVPAASLQKSLDELRGAFAGEPSRVSWGGGPPGGLEHVATVLLAKAVGVDPARLVYVPFLTAAEAVAALAEGHVAATIIAWGDAAADVKAGRLRVLGVSSPERVPFIDAPTLIEAGVALDFANWRGLVARPEMDAAARQELLADAARFAASQAWKDTLERRGWVDAYLPGDAFGDFIRAEHLRVKEALKALGVLKRADP